jgi:hypothetical protein
MSVGHPKNPGYKPGDHWFTCDVCGFEYRASEAKKRWDNLWVCKYDWEPRQTQDFVRGRKDKIFPDDPVRPQPNDDITSPTYSSIPLDNEVPAGTFGDYLSPPPVVSTDISLRLSYIVYNENTVPPNLFFDSLITEPAGVMLLRPGNGPDQRYFSTFNESYDYSTTPRNSVTSPSIVTEEPNTRVITIAVGFGTEINFGTSGKNLQVTAGNTVCAAGSKEETVQGTRTATETITMGAAESDVLNAAVVGLMPGPDLGGITPTIFESSSATSETGGVISVPFPDAFDRDGRIVLVVQWNRSATLPKLNRDAWPIAVMGPNIPTVTQDKTYPPELTALGLNSYALKDDHTFGTSNPLSDFDKVTQALWVQGPGANNAGQTDKWSVRQYDNSSNNFVFNTNSLDLVARLDPVIDNNTKLDHRQLNYDGGSGTLPSVGDTVTNTTQSETGIVLKLESGDNVSGVMYLHTVGNSNNWADNDSLTSGGWAASINHSQGVLRGKLISTGYLRSKRWHRYGLVEATLDLPVGRGMWSASPWQYRQKNNWPGGGSSDSEFDQMEVVTGNFFDGTTPNFGLNNSVGQPEALTLPPNLLRINGRSVKQFQNLTYDGGSGPLPTVKGTVINGPSANDTAVFISQVSGDNISGVMEVSVTTTSGGEFVDNDAITAGGWSATVNGALSPATDLTTSGTHRFSGLHEPSNELFDDLTFDTGVGVLATASDINNRTREITNTTKGEVGFITQRVSGNDVAGVIKIYNPNNSTWEDNDLLDYDSGTWTGAINGALVQDPAPLDKFYWWVDGVLQRVALMSWNTSTGEDTGPWHYVIWFEVGDNDGSGNFSSSPDDWTDFPATMRVFNVRQWTMPPVYTPVIDGWDTQLAFNHDNTWQDVTMPGIQGDMYVIHLTDTGGGTEAFGARPKQATGSHPDTRVNNIQAFGGCSIIVPAGDDGNIQLLANGAEVEFYHIGTLAATDLELVQDESTAATDITPVSTVTTAWETIALSPTGTRKAAIIEYTSTGANSEFGVRHPDSTRDVRGSAGTHNWFVCPMDASNNIEVYFEDSSITTVHLIGFVGEGFVSFERTDTLTGANNVYEDIAPLPPAAKAGVWIADNVDGPLVNIAIRAKGEGHEYFNRHNQDIIQLISEGNASRVVEGKTSSIANDALFLNGYFI